jgi:hypothetical protein
MLQMIAQEYTVPKIILHVHSETKTGFFYTKTLKYKIIEKGLPNFKIQYLI